VTPSRRRQDAEHNIQAPVQFEWLADGIRVGMQALAPEAIAHYCDGATLVSLGIESARRRINAEHIEEVRAGRHGPRQFTARSGPPVPVAERMVESEVLKDPRMLQVPIQGVRQIRVHTGKAVRLAGAQIIQNHFADDAIDRDVGADTEGQRSDGTCREYGGFPKPSHCLPDVGQ
jgi:hypothetical protein